MRKGGGGGDGSLSGMEERENRIENGGLEKELISTMS